MYSWWEQNIYALLFWLTDPGSRYDFIVLARAIVWLINSYLAICFLPFAFCFFSMTTLLQLGVCKKKNTYINLLTPHECSAISNVLSVNTNVKSNVFWVKMHAIFLFCFTPQKVVAPCHFISITLYCLFHILLVYLKEDLGAWTIYNIRLNKQDWYRTWILALPSLKV